jgi:hypothetical protein
MCEIYYHFSKNQTFYREATCGIMRASNTEEYNDGKMLL